MWITLTSDDLKGRLSKPELDRIPQAARAVGITPDQIVASALAEVSREIRGYCAVRFPLGPAGTIPDELEGAALALVRRVLFGRLPGLEDLFGQIRQNEVKDALALLVQVAAGKFQIVAPTSPAPESQQAGPAGPSISKRERNFKLEDQDGI